MRYCFASGQGPRVLEEVGSVGWVLHAQGQEVSEGLEYAGKTSGVFRLFYMVRGDQDWSVGGDRIVRQRTGQVLVLPPSQRYGVMEGRVSANEFFWLDLRFGGGRALPGIARAMSQELHSQFRAMANRCLGVRSTIRGCFERILSAYEKRRTFAEIQARAALHDLLLLVVEADTEVGERKRSRESPRVAEARRWLVDNLAEGPSMSELARHMGISAVYLRKKFTEEVGLSPSQFLAELRVEAAKKLLRESHNTIAVIASSVGLSSSQNFATFFRKHTGFTPAEYRRHISEQGSIQGTGSD